MADPFDSSADPQVEHIRRLFMDLAIHGPWTETGASIGRQIQIELDALWDMPAGLVDGAPSLPPRSASQRHGSEPAEWLHERLERIRALIADLARYGGSSPATHAIVSQIESDLRDVRERIGDVD